MQPERWQQIGELFDAAIARQPAQRAAFLDEVCNGDGRLRRQVELLVRSHESASDFIESPAFEAAPELLTDGPRESLIGQTLSHYKITSLLGAGGMGEVYLALDQRLGREIALKLLPERFTKDPTRVKRLHQEACTASALNHPNIVTIHELGEVDGRQYIAAEFVDGVTLRERLAQAPIALPDALDMAIQIGSALAAAHGAGIVHRDIKPDNVMIRADGYIKVLDFGIAKLAGQHRNSTAPRLSVNGTLSTDGSVMMGTAHYMSPEQAQRIEVDARTDVWSFGVVLYEMLTGHAPFEGETATAAIAAVLEKEPLPLARRLPVIPAQLQAVIDKALRKDRDDRYQTAAEMLSDLRRIHEDVIHRRSAASAKKVMGLSVAAAAAAVIVTALAFQSRPPAKNVEGENTSAVAPAISAKTIAVLPFKNLSDDQQSLYFVDGVQEEILTALAKVADLKVISRTSVMEYKAPAARDLPAISRALNVAHVLQGSVQRAAGRVRVTAQLVDARTDAQLWAERYDRDVADVFAIQSEIAESIAYRLQAVLSPSEQAAMAAKPTEDMVAYDLYLRARESERNNPAHHAEAIAEQVTLLNEAIARDPSFVPALLELARAHLHLYWFGYDRTPSRLALAKEGVEAAARLQPNAGEVHLARGRLYYWGSRDYTAALAELAVARRSLPNNPDVLHASGVIERRQGRWSESTRHFEQALSMDPHNNVILTDLGNNYCALKRYREAAQLFDKALLRRPKDFALAMQRAWVHAGATGDLRMLENTVYGDAAKNADADFVAFVRFDLALMQRNFRVAEEALAACPQREFHLRGFPIPREWFEAVIAQGLGSRDKAQSAFMAAWERAAATVTQRPADGKALMMLAKIDARLGRKEDALANGHRALELLPPARDAFDAPVMLEELASIHAHVGETSRALDLLEEMAKMPSAFVPTLLSLKLDEQWDPLRQEPRFAQLLASTAPGATK